MGHTRIGVFGAAFDPPTKGHEDAINQASKYFDKILIIPSFSHAFGKKMTDINLRLAMVQLFIQACQNPLMEMNLIEKDLLKTKGEPIYTFDVLAALEKQFPDAELSFIIGPDNATRWNQFYKSDEIIKRWGVFEVKENQAVHSTQVRTLCKKASSPQTLQKKLLDLTHPQIADYIMANHLYLE